MKLARYFKQKASLLKAEIRILYLAYQHPETPWCAKVFMAIVIGYMLSPIDLIPDFIPVLGYIDDLIIVPVGIFLALKMIPKAVLADCRDQAPGEPVNPKTKWLMAFIVLLIWLLAAYLIFNFIWRIIV